jgi:hypothetical protein
VELEWRLEDIPGQALPIAVTVTQVSNFARNRGVSF